MSNQIHTSEFWSQTQENGILGSRADRRRTSGETEVQSQAFTPAEATAKGARPGPWAASFRARHAGVSPPCLFPRQAATSEASHGCDRGGGVAARMGRGLRAVRAGLLRLQGSQHPGQAGVAGEIPRFGE